MKMKKGIALTACMMLMASSFAYGADQPVKEGKLSISNLFSRINISKYLEEQDLEDEVEVYLTIAADEEGRDGVMTVKVGGEDGEISTFNLSEEELEDLSEPMLSYTITTEDGFEVGEQNITFAIVDENGEIYFYNADGESALADLEDYMDGGVVVSIAAATEGADGEAVVSENNTGFKDLLKKLANKKI